MPFGHALTNPFTPSHRISKPGRTLTGEKLPRNLHDLLELILTGANQGRIVLLPVQLTSQRILGSTPNAEPKSTYQVIGSISTPRMAHALRRSGPLGLMAS